MTGSLTTIWCCISLLLPVTFYYLVLGASNTSCPTAFYYNNTTNNCECDEFYPRHGLINVCNQETGRAYLNTQMCVSSAADNDSYFIGVCPMPMKKRYILRFYSLLPRDPALLTDVMCGTLQQRRFTVWEVY
jgi:hypothetical protein